MLRDKINVKIQFILNDIEKMKKLNVVDIKQLDDFMIFHVVERLIEKIVDAATDINQMILKEQYNEVVMTAKQTFLSLASKGILETQFANSISNSVGLRNAIIHDYVELDVKRLFNAINLTISGYTEYCKQIRKHF